jgi:uncharacterized protein DUF4231
MKIYFFRIAISRRKVMEIEHLNAKEELTLETEQKFYHRFENWKHIYIRRIRRGLIYYHTTQLSILFGSALIPLLLTLPDVPKLIPTIISGIVLIASALSTYYKFADRVHHLQQTVDAIIEEETAKDLHTGPYQSLDRKAVFTCFVERTTKIIREQNRHSFTYGEVPKPLPSEVSSGI